MRIALVTENFLPKVDGVTRTLAMALEHFQRRGHRAILFGPDGGPRRYAGAKVYGAPGAPIPFYPELRFLLPLPRLEQRLIRFRPDVVHVVDPALLGAAGISWAKRLGAPVVSTYHTNLAAYCAHYHLRALIEPIWAYRRFLHNQCSVTLAPSRSTANELQRRGFERVGVWGRGVEHAVFTPEKRSTEWRRAMTGDEATPIALYTGRLASEKNLGDLLAAIDEIEQAGAWLVLVGDGPARGDLERALAGRRASFTGYLGGEALARAYASADIFVFPSLTETYGQVVVEAMASGLPVVAYDAEGVRDSIEHGRSGLLARAGDRSAFVTALRRGLSDQTLRAQLGAEARLRASRQEWPAVLDTLIDTYAEAIEGFQGDVRRTA
ncbi:MAG TPA: glycosyltransferase family 1 protein [Ktedonobacterales bacterium]